MKLAILTKASEIQRLKKQRIPLTEEEREECLKKKAVWHFTGKPTPAVWKAKQANGKIIYVTNTHRAYNTASTLKGAISKYHSFIKTTA